MAEVKLNQTEYRLLQAKSDFETGRMALNSIVGLELHSSTEIELLVPVLVVEDSLVYATDVVRPEVKIAEERVKVAESSLRLNDARYKPQICWRGGTYSSLRDIISIRIWTRIMWLMRSCQSRYLNGGNVGVKRASQGQVGVASDQLNRVKDNVALEIQTARLNLLQAQEQVKLTENSLETGE